MKFFGSLLAASALSLCACSAAPSVTAPSGIAVATSALLMDGFDPDFYRAFVQNGFESPTHLEPIRLLQRPFRVYLRTMDDSGRPIDGETLSATERTLGEAAPIWSAGTMTILEFVRGTSTRENTPGWITVKWSSAPTPDRCGRSTTGTDGGYIEFNATGQCACGGNALVYPRLIRHELGHAMGFFHTDSPADVMYGRTIAPDACDLLPSARERLHARVAHQIP